MTESVVDTSYEPFSREPEYLELNRAFLRSLGLERPRRIVDVACGTGTLMALLLTDLTQQDASGAKVQAIGVDLSRTSLMIGLRELAADAGRLSLIEASGDCLPIRSAWADIVLLGNAIHCFPDLTALLAEVRRVLRPGGVFAFNSSFYAGTFLPGTEHFYTEWLKEALAVIERKNLHLRQEGKPAVVRTRGHGRVAFSRPWLSATQYTQALEQTGFTVHRLSERMLAMTRRNFETVGAYEGLAAVLLSGFPVGPAARALMEAAGPAMASVGMTTVPRNWLEVSVIRC